MRKLPATTEHGLRTSRKKRGLCSSCTSAVESQNSKYMYSTISTEILFTLGWKRQKYIVHVREYEIVTRATVSKVRLIHVYLLCIWEYLQLNAVNLHSNMKQIDLQLLPYLQYTCTSRATTCQTLWAAPVVWWPLPLCSSRTAWRSTCRGGDGGGGDGGSRLSRTRAESYSTSTWGIRSRVPPRFGSSAYTPATPRSAWGDGQDFEPATHCEICILFEAAEDRCLIQVHELWRLSKVPSQFDYLQHCIYSNWNSSQILWACDKGSSLICQDRWIYPGIVMMDKYGLVKPLQMHKITSKMERQAWKLPK